MLTFWALPTKLVVHTNTPSWSRPSVGKSENAPGAFIVVATPFQVPVGSLVAETASSTRLLVLAVSNAAAIHRPLSGSQRIRSSPVPIPLAGLVLRPVMPALTQNCVSPVREITAPVVLLYTVKVPLVSSTKWFGPIAPCVSGGMNPKPLLTLIKSGERLVPGTFTPTANDSRTRSSTGSTARG